MEKKHASYYHEEPLEGMLCVIEEQFRINIGEHVSNVRKPASTHLVIFLH